MADYTFWIVAAFTVTSAAIVVLNNQLIYSAVALLFTLFGVAGLYVFLWADFIAGVQLLVYVGGILVLPAMEPTSGVAQVGILLLTKYLLPFEVVSVLLLGALIGAAVLSREDT